MRICNMKNNAFVRIKCFYLPAASLTKQAGQDLSTQLFFYLHNSRSLLRFFFSFRMNISAQGQNIKKNLVEQNSDLSLDFVLTRFQPSDFKVLKILRMLEKLYRN